MSTADAPANPVAKTEGKVEIAPQPAGANEFWRQVSRGFFWARRVVVGVAVVFVLMLFSEIVQIYAAADQVNPLLGYAWLAVVSCCGILLAMPVIRYFSVPRVVEPPDLPDFDQLRLKDIKTELRYLDLYLANCQRNKEFENESEELSRARAELKELSAKVMTVAPDKIDDFADELAQWVVTRVDELLKPIDAKAEKIIYQESLAVGVATAVSPNGTLDAFLMLWRSLNVVSKLAVLYYGRPGLWGTLAVARDVSLATAMAGFLHNVTQSLGGLLQGAFHHWSGMLAGPAAQGVTNGLVLIRIGYLARERCRSFRRWDRKARTSALGSALGATSKVALGLTKEILSKVGVSVGQVAGAAASGAASAAGKAGQTAKEWGQQLGEAASQAFANAREWTSSVGQRFHRFGHSKPAAESAE